MRLTAVYYASGIEKASASSWLNPLKIEENLRLGDILPLEIRSHLVPEICVATLQADTKHVHMSQARRKCPEPETTMTQHYHYSSNVTYLDSFQLLSFAGKQMLTSFYYGHFLFLNPL